MINRAALARSSLVKCREPLILQPQRATDDNGRLRSEEVVVLVLAHFLTAFAIFPSTFFFALSRARIPLGGGGGAWGIPLVV